jgi:hypothetical protein
VAVEKGFYDDAQAELEDDFANVEGRYAQALRDLRNGAAPQTLSEILSEFVWTLALRTRAARDQGRSTARDFLDLLPEMVDSPEMAAAIDKELRKQRETATDEKRLAIELLLGNPGLRALGQQSAGKVLRLAANAAEARRVLDEVIGRVQVLGLSSLLEHQSTPHWLQSAVWRLARQDDVTLVLGDCGAVAFDSAQGAKSPLSLGDSSLHVCLPVSASELVLASKTATKNVPSFADVNRASSALSARFIYSTEQLNTDDELLRLIGSHEPFLGKGDLDAMLAQLKRDL